MKNVEVLTKIFTPTWTTGPLQRYVERREVSFSLKPITKQSQHSRISELHYFPSSPAAVKPGLLVFGPELFRYLSAGTFLVDHLARPPQCQDERCICIWVQVRGQAQVLGVSADVVVWTAIAPSRWRRSRLEIVW